MINLSYSISFSHESQRFSRAIRVMKSINLNLEYHCTCHPALRMTFLIVDLYLKNHDFFLCVLSILFIFLLLYCTPIVYLEYVYTAELQLGEVSTSLAYRRHKRKWNIISIWPFHSGSLLTWILDYFLGSNYQWYHGISPSLLSIDNTLALYVSAALLLQPCQYWVLQVYF